MTIENVIPFQTIDWDHIPATAYDGETGTAYWKTTEFSGLRIRMITYTAGYMADHWCRKGHIVHCLQGSFVSELENGESYTLSAGMSYVVSDEMSSHKSISRDGVKLLIIDGDFLQRDLRVIPDK